MALAWIFRRGIEKSLLRERGSLFPESETRRRRIAGWGEATVFADGSGQSGLEAFVSDDQSSTEPARPTLIYPFDAVPVLGKAVEIARGVLWIRMPMPFALNHINLWAIEDGPGWAIVDTGLQTRETGDAWRELFAGALGHRPITRVFVTHMHPDHVGMAGWITRKFDCRLWMSRLEYLTCRTLVADTGREPPQDGIRFYQRAGWGEGAMETSRERFGTVGKRV